MIRNIVSNTLTAAALLASSAAGVAIASNPTVAPVEQIVAVAAQTGSDGQVTPQISASVATPGGGMRIYDETNDSTSADPQTELKSVTYKRDKAAGKFTVTYAVKAAGVSGYSTRFVNRNGSFVVKAGDARSGCGVTRQTATGGKVTQTIPLACLPSGKMHITSKTVAKNGATADTLTPLAY